MNKTFSFSNIIPILFLVISFIGFVDASYLTYEHYYGNVPACAFLTGCEEVLTSEYSVIFGFPVALLGAFYYLVFFLGTIVYFDIKNPKIIKYLSLFSVIGLISSAWFIYLMFFVINQLCEYCLLSATTSSLLFIIGMGTLINNRKTA